MLLVRLQSDEGHCDAFYLPNNAVFADAKKRFCNNFQLDPDTTHLCVSDIEALPDDPLELCDGQEIFVKTESGQLKTRKWPVRVCGYLFSFYFELPAGRPPSKQELYKLAVEAAPGFDYVYINDDGVHPLRPDDKTGLDKLTLLDEPYIEIHALPKGYHKGPGDDQKASKKRKRHLLLLPVLARFQVLQNRGRLEQERDRLEELGGNNQKVSKKTKNLKLRRVSKNRHVSSLTVHA